MMISRKRKAHGIGKSRRGGPTGGTTREKEHLELVFEIRDKLKEYSAYDGEDLVPRANSDSRTGEAVLLESTLLSMRRSSKRTFEAFYNVFHNVDATGVPLPTLGGPSAKILDDWDDLVALQSPRRRID